MAEVDYTITNIRLRVDDLKDLKVYAAQKGRSVSSLVREIVAKFLSEVKTKTEAKKRDSVWRLGDKPVNTGDPHLAQRIDEILYEASPKQHHLR